LAVFELSKQLDQPPRAPITTTIGTSTFTRFENRRRIDIDVDESCAGCMAKWLRIADDAIVEARPTASSTLAVLHRHVWLL